MKIAVVGGGLQGTEAAYLAHKAGWDVLLIDKQPDPPASGLCDDFVQMDVRETHMLRPIFKNIDLVIPALENQAALESLVEWSRTADVPLAFDADAYGISSSKLESDRVFTRLGVPAPRYWPDCGFPVIAKPSRGSGSKNIQIFNHRQQLDTWLSLGNSPGDWVLQEYLDGPCFSLEVVGTPGDYTPVRVTDLEMDARYDCMRVLAPTQLVSHQVNQFEQISLDIAEAIKLNGLMDVEVILHNGELKVLEIDARLPSQTPTAVYWSSGINMLELLAQCYLGKKIATECTEDTEKKGVVYEHISVANGAIEVCGEHIMAEAGPLHLQTDFFGADEAISNYAPGRGRWAATLIIAASHHKEAMEKQDRVIDEIQRKVDTSEGRQP